MRLTPFYLIFLLVWGVGVTTGYQIGKHKADNYYYNHPYIPRLSEVMDPKAQKVLTCQFDNEPLERDRFVTPSLLIPGQCHTSDHYSKEAIGEVIDTTKVCCPVGWIGRIRMYDSLD